MMLHEKKMLAAQEALKYVPEDNVVIGIGTGSTVNCFIEALAGAQKKPTSVVTTSQASKQLLQKYGFNILTLNEVDSLPIYFDGADEVNSFLQMLKGGGGALLAEKIVASSADQFVCMVDESKYVKRLGKFPVVVEVLPYARSLVSKKMIALGGRPELRIGYTTERENQIIDVYDLDISQPLQLEYTINHIPGVVENGIFARHPAHLLIIGTDKGAVVRTIQG